MSSKTQTGFTGEADKLPWPHNVCVLLYLFGF